MCVCVYVLQQLIICKHIHIRVCIVCVFVLILIVIFIEHAMSSRPQVCLNEEVRQQKTETSLRRLV